jgi:hypothetical protein
MSLGEKSWLTFGEKKKNRIELGRQEKEHLRRLKRAQSRSHKTVSTNKKAKIQSKYNGKQLFLKFVILSHCRELM